LLQKPFPNEKDESLQNKWDALTKKLINIRFLETYHMLRCADGGLISQYEHTVWIAPGGAEILTIL
jgi:methionine aminopeptidase